MDKRVTVKCSKCGREYQASMSNYKKRLKNGKPLYCHECGKIEAAKAHSEKYHNMTPEEKEKWSKAHSVGQKKRYSKMTEEEKKASVKTMRAGLDKWKENLTEEGWEEFKKKALEGKKNMSKEAYDKMIANMSAGRMKYLDSLDEEGLAKQREYVERAHKASKEWWKNLSTEERQRRLDELHENADNWRSKLTEEELKLHTAAAVEAMKMLRQDEDWNIQLSNNIKSALDARSPEAKALQIARHRESWNDPEKLRKYRILRQELWRNKTPEEKKAQVFKTLRSSNGKNKFHQQFEDTFLKSGLNDYFYFVSENPIGTDNIHSWDYGIYDQNGVLVAVVDLDGVYFHADVCDYDGTHSKEEYDERRGLSVSDNVIPIILNENNLDDTFNHMTKLLPMTHKEYVDYMFRIYRAMPFPTPTYTDRELIRSYDSIVRMDCNDKYHRDLSMNTRLGDRIIYHYHPSIYHQTVPGFISPYDAWYDDDVLKQHIESHIFYHTHLNKNKILQEFAISPVAPRIRFMSGGKAKMIINRYLSEYDTVFDPNMGYGGRMLGVTSLDKKYMGICKDDVLFKENINMIEFIQEYFVVDGEINPTGTEFPCMFTEVENDDEITQYLSTYKCSKYVFVTPNTEKYKQYEIDYIESRSINEPDKFIIMI